MVELESSGPRGIPAPGLPVVAADASQPRLLEEQVVPAFYERDPRGVPVRWMAIVKEAIRTVASRFCARRMVKQYVEQMYVPQAADAGSAIANAGERAIDR